MKFHWELLLLLMSFSSALFPAHAVIVELEGDGSLNGKLFNIVDLSEQDFEGLKQQVIPDHHGKYTLPLVSFSNSFSNKTIPDEALSLYQFSFPVNSYERYGEIEEISHDRLLKHVVLESITRFKIWKSKKFHEKILLLLPERGVRSHDLEEKKVAQDEKSENLSPRERKVQEFLNELQSKRMIWSNDWVFTVEQHLENAMRRHHVTFSDLNIVPFLNEIAEIFKNRTLMFKGDFEKEWFEGNGAYNMNDYSLRRYRLTETEHGRNTLSLIRVCAFFLEKGVKVTKAEAVTCFKKIIVPIQRDFSFDYQQKEIMRQPNPIRLFEAPLRNIILD